MTNHNDQDHIPTTPLPPGEIEPTRTPQSTADAHPVHVEREPFFRRHFQRRWVRISSIVAGCVLLLGIGAGLGLALEDADDWWDAEPHHSEIDQRNAADADAS